MGTADQEGPESQELVYVIGGPGSSVVKIGRTTNLSRRLTAIQSMSPLPLRVLVTFAGGSPLESALHRHFRTLRTHGEWFDFGDAEPVPAIEAAVALGEEILNRQGSERRRSFSSDASRSPWPPYDPTRPYWVYPEEVEPGRCVCGHQSGSHSFDPPHGCGGEVPYNGLWCENYCLCGKYDDSPETHARVKATHPRHPTEWAETAHRYDKVRGTDGR